MAKARLRTAQGVLDELRKEDPDTAVTLSAIRRFLKTGRVPVIRVGNKQLVNFDEFCSCFLESGSTSFAVIDVAPFVAENDRRGIRKV